ncbi:hydrogenase 3 maturation protease [Salmonella enterica subsp. enterica serovar Typhimurium]|nr:hydrogenase 3 maturation protease [Salmonella enterica subsp. enterica serovar Typhimurium]
MTDVLLCVGNSMMGDDGAGPLLAEMCAAQPKGNWVVIDGGSAPENDIVAIRELRPQRLLIVDATDMGLNPGEIRIIDPDDIAEMFYDDHPQYAAQLPYRSAERGCRGGDFCWYPAGYRRVLLSDDSTD